jgi:hypothetical protein
MNNKNNRNNRNNNNNKNYKNKLSNSNSNENSNSISQYNNKNNKNNNKYNTEDEERKNKAKNNSKYYNDDDEENYYKNKNMLSKGSNTENISALYNDNNKGRNNNKYSNNNNIYDDSNDDEDNDDYNDNNKYANNKYSNNKYNSRNRDSTPFDEYESSNNNYDTYNKGYKGNANYLDKDKKDGKKNDSEKSESMLDDEDDYSYDDSKKDYYNSILQKIKKKPKIDLNHIFKYSNLFLSKNIKDDDKLGEKFEYTLDLNKYLDEDIKKMKKNGDNNLLTPKEAVYCIDEIIIRFLGYLGGELYVRGITTYIEKVPTNESLREIIFKVLASGVATQQNFKISVTNKKLISKFEEDNIKWLYFLDKIKAKIIKRFNVNEEDIYFFGHKKENFEVNLVIYNQRINELENYLRKFEFKVSTFALMKYAVLSPCIFEQDFCKDEKSWKKKILSRGGRLYEPPYGWYGISLKINNKYGRDDNVWLGNEDRQGEWPVAFHALRKGKINIFDKILRIMNGNMNDEIEDKFHSYKNVEKNSNTKKYPYCEEGMLLFPSIEDAANYADKASLGFFHQNFQFVFMTRINNNKIRSPKGLPVKWIVNPNSDEVRPYRLLIKII